MSMSSLRFGCDHCSFVASSTVNWGVFNYVVGHREIPVLRELGWCSRCETIRPIEVLPTAESLESLRLERTSTREQFNSALPWLLKMFRVELRTNSVLQRLGADLDRLDKHLLKMEELLAAMAGRRSRPRCLFCESEDVSELPKFEVEEAEDPDQDGPVSFAFAHPGCAGNIEVSRPSIRWSVALKKRTYDQEGHLLSTSSA